MDRRSEILHLLKLRPHVDEMSSALKKRKSEIQLGSLVPVNDPNKLSLSIQDMLNIKHDTNKLIKRAKDFSVSKIGDKYIKYFKAN